MKATMKMTMKGNMKMKRRIETDMERNQEMCMENGNSRELKSWRSFLREEDGMGTVEVILIIVVLVGLVIIFKEQITKIVTNLFNKITTQTGKI